MQANRAASSTFLKVTVGDLKGTGHFLQYYKFYFLERHPTSQGHKGERGNFCFNFNCQIVFARHGKQNGHSLEH